MFQIRCTAMTSQQGKEIQVRLGQLGNGVLTLFVKFRLFRKMFKNIRNLSISVKRIKLTYNFNNTLTDYILDMLLLKSVINFNPVLKKIKIYEIRIQSPG